MLKREPIRPDMVADESRVASLPRVAAGLSDAAAMLGISKNSLIKLIDAGEIRDFNAGSRRLIAVAELQRYVQQRTEEADSDSDGP